MPVVRSLTLKQLTELYLAWAAEYYIKPSTGQPTRTALNSRCAVKRLLEMRESEVNEGTLFALRSGTIADMPAAQFDAKMLYAYQQHLVSQGKSRNTINDYVSRIQAMFKWACHPARELVDQSVHAKLCLVDPLHIGRSRAKEPGPIKAVSLEAVQATAMCAPPMASAMIWVQWHTGMRPGEVCMMRHSWIDKTEISLETGERLPRWIYRPRTHKLEHKGIERVVPLNAHARKVLERWIDLSPHLGDCIFPGRRGDKPVTRCWYSFIIRLTNEKFGLDDWQPKQIRRSFATRVANAFDKEKAALLLGHTNSRVTSKHYIERDVMRVAELLEQFE